jgi:tetratricopeptide (TPR) repeat protein
VTTSFIPDQIQGRNPHYVNHERELDEAVAAFDRAEGNLVIVFSGVAGSGKTATAWELAFRVKDRFPDARLFAQLGGTLEQEGAEAEILRDFLAEFGVPPESLPDRLPALRARYQALTAGKRVLVLVDGAVRASQVRALLPGDGRSLVLVTGGQALADLAVDTPTELFDLSPLTDEAATELLARLLGEDRVAAERGKVAELIGLCGNLPIALCVVASMLRRPRNRTVASTVERLRDERRRLVALSPSSDLSVSAAFTAAHRQLGDSAQRCYVALGLSSRTGIVTADALAAVLGLPFYEVAEALAELSESRFIEVIGEDRYTVSDLVALHASSLDDREDGARAAETERLLAYYHQRTYDADATAKPNRSWRRTLFPDLRSRGAFDDPAAATRWFEDERATLAKLVAYAFERGDLERVCSWCVLLWPFYEAGKHLADLFATHRLGVEAADALGDRGLGSLLRTQLGFGHYWARELPDAARLFGAAVDRARAAGVRELEATALEGQGLTLIEQGSPDALAVLRRNLELAVEIGDDQRIAIARLHLAKSETAETGLRLLVEAAAHFAAVADVVNSGKCDTWRGRHLLTLGRAEEAVAVLNGAVGLMARLRRRFDESEALLALGDAYLATGRPAEAERCWREALSCYDDLGLTTRADETRVRLDGLTAEEP